MNISYRRGVHILCLVHILVLVGHGAVVDADLVNIALEGKMLMGAFAAAAIALVTHSAWLGVAGAVLAGAATAVIYGLLMCALYRWRKDMLSLVVAHATTNLALALYVWTTGDWGYWG